MRENEIAKIVVDVAFQIHKRLGRLAFVPPRRILCVLAPLREVSFDQSAMLDGKQSQSSVQVNGLAFLKNMDQKHSSVEWGRTRGGEERRKEDFNARE